MYACDAYSLCLQSIGQDRVGLSESEEGFLPVVVEDMKYIAEKDLPETLYVRLQTDKTKTELNYSHYECRKYYLQFIWHVIHFSCTDPSDVALATEDTVYNMQQQKTIK